MISPIKTNLILLVILITALLWAAAAAPIQPTPKAPVAMKRVSSPISYLAALDRSLVQGIDSVNWKDVTWPKL